MVAFHCWVNVYLPGEYGLRHLCICSSAICVSFGGKISQSVQAATEKKKNNNYRLGCVNDKHVLCIILETGKSKDKVLDNPGSNEGPCAAS